MSLVNVGNALATVTFGTPTDPPVLARIHGRRTVRGGNPGTPVAATAFDFTPAGTATGERYRERHHRGQYLRHQRDLDFADGSRSRRRRSPGYPSTVDFGLTECGGGTPTPKIVTLTNTGAVDAHVTTASVTGPPGFTTSAAAGQTIAANGGTLLVGFTAPAVPASSALTPITATVSLQTDADASPQTITLSESPHGATVLAFDPVPDSELRELRSSHSPSGGLAEFQRHERIRATKAGKRHARRGVERRIRCRRGSPGDVQRREQHILGGRLGHPDRLRDLRGHRGPYRRRGALSMTATGTAVRSPARAHRALPSSGIGGGPAVAPTSLAFNATCGGGAPAPSEPSRSATTEAPT